MQLYGLRDLEKVIGHTQTGRILFTLELSKFAISIPGRFKVNFTFITSPPNTQMLHIKLKIPNY